MKKCMKWIMILCICINIFCIVANSIAGNFGNLPINIVALSSCIAAIASD